MATPATDKQIGYIIHLCRERGYPADSWIDSELGKAMGLSMRERSGAGKIRDFVQDIDKYEASKIIGRLTS